MLEQYGCCKGIEKITPERVENRPGLKALNYRIGTHATFLATMLARLSDLACKAEDRGTEYQETEENTVYPLRGLTTRESDDFSIALLDAWATVGDVLTFYQERIANEGYLLTATELRSILELARLIGYRLKPGVSSGVDLAFTLEKGYQVEIPAGTRVQSLPAPGEAAQAFETSYKVKARSDWNEIKARLSMPQSITWAKASGTEEFSIYLQGIDLNLKPNQAMLFVFDGESKQALRLIKSAESQPLQDRTKVTLQKSNPHPMVSVSAARISHPLISSASISRGALSVAAIRRLNVLKEKQITSQTEVMEARYYNPDIRNLYPVVKGRVAMTVGEEKVKKEVTGNRENQEAKASTVPRDPWIMGVYVLRQTASLFGHNAPEYRLTGYTSGVPNFELQSFYKTGNETPLYETDDILYLDSSYEKILPGSWIVVKGPGEQIKPIIKKARIVATSPTRSAYGITGKTTRIELEKIESKVFNWNAMLPAPSNTETDQTTPFDKFREVVVYGQSEDLTAKLAEEPIDTDVDGKHIELDGYYSGLEAGWQMIVAGQTSDEEEIAGLAVAERATVGDIFHGLKTNDYGSPAPVLVFDDQFIGEDDISIRYRLSVKNWQFYPRELFEKLPDEENSRIIIEIKSLSGMEIKRPEKAAALNSPSDLKGLWFETSAKKLSFDAIKTEDNAKTDFKNFLSKRYPKDANWIMGAIIGVEDSKITLSKDATFLSLMLKDEEAKLEFYDGRTDIFKTKKDISGQINLYVPDNSPEFVYIVMTDLKDNVTYISNLVPLRESDKDLSELPPPPQLLLKSKTGKEKSTQYNLLVANWIDYHESSYKVEIFGDKEVDTEQKVYGEEMFLYCTLLNKSPKDLSSLSLDLDPHINPDNLYVVLTPTPNGEPQNASQKSYISNLASTDMMVFLPGDRLHTTLVLASELGHSYKRDTVKIYLNLAHATHGETRREVLGSGDGSQALQQFALRQSPLTYLPAPTPAGAQSTLAVRANDVLWHETNSLAGLGANDHNFITRTDDKGRTGVVFGNGREGSRLPTGLENVTAVYRTGMGKPGNLKAGQIRLLATRPLGVKGVINPLPATGGVDPEDVSQARKNAPLAVMALDRLVSVQDHEDFARSYAGIGKASALRISDGQREVVHLSVAGIDDIPLDQDSDLFKNLFQALHDYGDPRLPVLMDVCERVLLLIKASVRLHPDYLWSSVEPKIRRQLLNDFGFASRELGQDVVASEVISAIQRVQGVVYVDLDILDAVSETNSLDPAALAKKMADLKEPSTADKDKLPEHRIVAEEAGIEEDKEGIRRIKPAQIAYLSPDIPETIVLKELM